MKIIAYKKYVDKSITRTLALLMDKQQQFIGLELATLSDGLTYVSMPKATVLPTQPKEIKASVKTVTLTKSQIAEIKLKSPHVALINERVREVIRKQYTTDDELKFARLSTAANTSATDKAAIATYHTFTETARTKGQADKAALGL